jgi:site-specific DNA-methyltransferase (adenine-specific)
VTPYQLHHAESLTTLRSLPSHSVDAIITDPPYSSGGLHMTARTQRSTTDKYVVSRGEPKDPHEDFSGDNRDQRSFVLWCTLWLTECLRVAKPGAPVILFTDWRQLPSTTDYLQAAGATWRGIFPWLKPAGRPGGRGRFRNASEFAVWGSNGDMPARSDLDYLPGYHVESVRRSDKHHITGKPTGLMRELVKCCPKGGVVLDPFNGSGTTGVAAILEGRQYIGIEQKSSNISKSLLRLDDALSQTQRSAA